jgi:hypothetical protein
MKEIISYPIHLNIVENQSTTFKQFSPILFKEVTDDYFPQLTNSSFSLNDNTFSKYINIANF